jgi:ABC-type transporter Mla subunit MlaD
MTKTDRVPLARKRVKREPGSELTPSTGPEAKQSVLGALRQLRTSMKQTRSEAGKANRSLSSRAILKSAAGALAQLEELSRHNAASAEHVAVLTRSAASLSTVPPGNSEELGRAAESLARALESCERLAAEWLQLAATSNRLREAVEQQARDGLPQLDDLAEGLVQTLDKFIQMETGETSGSGGTTRSTGGPPPAAVARPPLAAPVPTHPCATCAHSTEVECSTVAEGLRAERGAQCRGCLHECLPRAMPNPSPPGAMVQPNVVVPNAMSPPTPLSPVPDLGPPPGPNELDRGLG